MPQTPPSKGLPRRDARFYSVISYVLRRRAVDVFAWRGARLPDMDPPFDLGWLHNIFAWTAEYIGRPLLWVFGVMIVLLPIVAAFTEGFRTGPPVVAGSCTRCGGPPALAVGWFVLTQVAALVAPLLGMYHGDSSPAVP